MRCDKARESTSKGLLDVYHPQTSELITAWLFEQKEEYIRNNLIFHIAKFCELDLRYASVIESEFASLNKSTKDTIFELVKKTSTYGVLKKLDAKDSTNLFFEGDNIMGSKMDFSGSKITGNNVSIAAGDSKIEQNISLISDENREDVDEYIEEVEDVIDSLSAEHDTEIVRRIDDAKNEIKKFKALPSKENLNRIIENVTWIDDKFKTMKDLEMVKHAKPLGKWILKLLALAGTGSL